MIKSIKVINRFHADCILGGLRLPPSSYWYMISIYGWPDKPLLTPPNIVSALDLQCVKYLSLCFNDLTKKQFEETKKAFPDTAKNITLFNEKQAKEIISFVNDLQSDPNEGDLIVHCHAGISRSGAVATFIAKRIGMEFHDSEIRPNPYVTFILEQVGKQGILEKDRNIWTNNTK